MMQKTLFYLFLTIFPMFLSARVPWAGREVVALGDSNTWLGGEDGGDRTGWTGWVREIGDAAGVRSYARSGATWSHTLATQVNPRQDVQTITDDNVITNQVFRLSADLADGSIRQPGIVVVAAGVNDAWFQDMRPDALKGGVARAVAHDVAMLRTICPEAQIIIVTPALNGKVDDETMHRLADAIEAACKDRDVSVVRADLDKGMTGPGMTSDGVHTTPKGAKRMAEIIMGL